MILGGSISKLAKQGGNFRKVMSGLFFSVASSFHLRLDHLCIPQELSECLASGPHD